MYFFYNLILITLFVILSPVILILFLIKPKLRAGFFSKIGFYKDYKKGNSLAVKELRTKKMMK